MWYRPRPGMGTHGLALLGMFLMVIGFGMLTLDAAIGIMLIPAGLLLFVFGHARRDDRARERSPSRRMASVSRSVDRSEGA